MNGIKIKEIKNARRLENGAIDCEVLFEGMKDFIPYTSTPEDTATTGQQIWQELQSGKWGDIAPFTVSPALLDAATAAKRQAIAAWRTEQDAKTSLLESTGRIWNAAPDSLASLSHEVMQLQSSLTRDVPTWG